MVPLRKQRRMEIDDENSSSSDDSSETSSPEMETIEVDFDVRMPEEVDFHGIKNILRPLFLKADIDTSELSDLLIQQRKITAVIKQAEDDGMVVDDDDLDVVFGVFSVINLTAKRNLNCVKQITSLLLSFCKKSCEDEQFQLFRSILENCEKHVGLIISERMLNIPPKISVPLYSGLSYDMDKAKAKGENFNFDYFLLISKIIEFEKGTPSILYSNAEEELIYEVATLAFDFVVDADSDTVPGGEWVKDKVGHRKRRVMLFPASSYGEICHKLTSEIGT